MTAGLLRSRRAGVGALTLGVVLLLTPVGVWAQSGSSAGLFNMSAEAAGMSIAFGDPASQPYPVAAGTVPETFATLSTGPSGYALSSVAWPGPLLANAGSLAGLLLPACVPQAGVCTPKPDSQTTNLANYPVRAEAQSPGGTGAQTMGPMTARVEGATSDASASAADFDSTGFVSSAKTSTHSRSYIDGDRAISLAESTTSGVEVAGGVVKMSSVRSFVKISSDGRTTSIERRMIVQGLEIDGHPATIDSKGVHVEGQGGDPAPAVIEPLNKNLLAPFGIEVFLTRPVEERRAGGEAVANTGALVVLWKLGDSGEQIVVSLGGAGAHVQASPGFAVFLDGGVTVAPAAFGGPSGTIGAAAVKEAAAAGGGSPRAGFVPQAPAAAAAPAIVTQPASGQFRGVPPGWVVVGVLGGVLIGFGLRRVQTGGLVPVGACEKERTA
jgi:hypothetical protein